MTKEIIVAVVSSIITAGILWISGLVRTSLDERQFNQLVDRLAADARLHEGIVKRLPTNYQIASSKPISWPVGAGVDRRTETFDFPVRHAWVEIQDAPLNVGFINIRDINGKSVSYEAKPADNAKGGGIYRIWATSF